MALSHLEDRPPADVPDYYPLRRRKVWALDPDWEVPWPHEPRRPDLPLEEPAQKLEQTPRGDSPPTS